MRDKYSDTTYPNNSNNLKNIVKNIYQSDKNLNENKDAENITGYDDTNYKLTGYNNRYNSEKSNNKSFYNTISQYDPQLLSNNILSVGSITYYDKKFNILFCFWSSILLLSKT